MDPDSPWEGLGQHLLRDAEVIAAVIAAAKLEPGEFVLDAGAGTGALTHPISEAVGPKGRVFAVEFDPRMIERLKTDLPENAQIIQADLLEVGLNRDIDAIVANPPFKILAPLIERIAASGIPRAVLVVPRELSNRLTAPAGTERYGSLTIRVGILADVAFVGPVARRAFRPSAGVDCAIISMRTRKGVVAPDPAVLKTVIKAATDAWDRKAKYAFALLSDSFRVDSAAFQKLLRDEGWADQVAATLPPRAFGVIARFMSEHGKFET